ncbi:MAG: hypothetical protein AB7O62_02765 [Pirellulales bacterium]
MTPASELIGQIVVLDLASPWVYIGRLTKDEADYLVLEDVDAHDLRDTSTSREKYVLDCRLHGVTPNRRQTWVNRRDLVGVTRLDDIIAD